jgi:hypothetical protein
MLRADEAVEESRLYSLLNLLDSSLRPAKGGTSPRMTQKVLFGFFDRLGCCHPQLCYERG